MGRIRHARRRLGLSQEELAAASGVSAATIVQAERGNRQPQGRTLRKLAAALGVEVADLVEEEGEPTAEPTLEAWLEERVGHAHLSDSQEEVCRLVSGPHGEQILALMREEMRVVAEERKKYPAMDSVRIAGVTYAELSRKYIAAVFAADLSGLVAQDYLAAGLAS